MVAVDQQPESALAVDASAQPDRKAEVMALLQDRPDLDVKALSRRCGVPASTVYRWRRELR